MTLPNRQREYQNQHSPTWSYDTGVCRLWDLVKRSVRRSDLHPTSSILVLGQNSSISPVHWAEGSKGRRSLTVICKCVLFLYNITLPIISSYIIIFWPTMYMSRGCVELTLFRLFNYSKDCWNNNNSNWKYKRFRMERGGRGGDISNYNREGPS